MSVDTIGNISAAAIVALVITGVVWMAQPNPVKQYKVNQCIMKMPPQVPDVLDRCTAAVWMEENK